MDRNCCAGVAVPALLTNVSCLDPVVPLPDLAQGILLTVLRGVRPVHPSLYSEGGLLRISYFGPSVAGFPLALQYSIPYCKGLPLGLVALVAGAAVGSVSPFHVLSSLFSFIDLNLKTHNPVRLYIAMALARVLLEVPVMNAKLQDQTLMERFPPPGTL